MQALRWSVVVAMLAVPAAAEIRRDPVGVNVNASGATTVLITFGGLVRQEPVEAIWCSEVVPAAPDRGQKCAPGTVFGRLPLRLDQSKLQGGAFTDVMTIPPSVARRAYEDAARGGDGVFFYVRRFRSLDGGPDEFVPVTCRLTGGGARAPFALLDVALAFAGDPVLPTVAPGTRPPATHATICYNGTGRLRGRWEIVQPGEPLPGVRDLLPEGALPADERAQQRRWTQVGRFNAFLPPTGTFELEGPEPARLPTATEGLHLVLLRVEATDDRESDSNLAAAGAGTGVLHSGGVAGFPMPVLRYYVGSAEAAPKIEATSDVQPLSPLDQETIAAGRAVDFHWSSRITATVYRLEVADTAGTIALKALVEPGTLAYRAPDWLRGKSADGYLKWRVVALGPGGTVLAESPWRALKFAP